MATTTIPQLAQELRITTMDVALHLDDLRAKLTDDQLYARVEHLRGGHDTIRSRGIPRHDITIYHLTAQAAGIIRARVTKARRATPTVGRHCILIGEPRPRGWQIVRTLTDGRVVVRRGGTFRTIDATRLAPQPTRRATARRA